MLSFQGIVYLILIRSLFLSLSLSLLYRAVFSVLDWFPDYLTFWPRLYSQSVRCALQGVFPSYTVWRHHLDRSVFQCIFSCEKNQLNKLLLRYQLNANTSNQYYSVRFLLFHQCDILLRREITLTELDYALHVVLNFISIIFYPEQEITLTELNYAIHVVLDSVSMIFYPEQEITLTELDYALHVVLDSVSMIHYPEQEITLTELQ